MKQSVDSSRIWLEALHIKHELERGMSSGECGNFQPRGKTTENDKATAALSQYPVTIRGKKHVTMNKVLFMNFVTTRVKTMKRNA